MTVVELLTARVWVLHVLPRLLRRRLSGAPAQSCWFIDASAAGALLSRLLAPIAGVRVERLDFRLVDIRDDEGQLIRLRIAYADLAQVQSDVVNEPRFQSLLREYGRGSRLAAFVEKSVATISLSDRTTLWRALLLVQIALWKQRSTGGAEMPELVLERRAWMAAIRRYAERNGVRTIEVRPAIDVLRAAREFGRRVRLARRLRDSVMHWWVVGRKGGAGTPRPASTASQPRIAVQYHGQFNLEDPAKYSDLFFWQQSDLEGRDLVMLFPVPSDPLDAAKWAQLKAEGIGAVGIYPGAVTVPDAPIYTPAASVAASTNSGALARDWPGPERAWLRQTESMYNHERDYWAGLFREQNARIYITWQRFDAQHFAIADAMSSVGGITAIYQRAYQPDAAPEIAVNADLMFGYAPADADVEQRSGSAIGHHVAVGYFGDHRFPLLRESAAAMREQLRAAGADFVVAFFDENSAPDSRWHTGHEFMRDNYQFLLEQLLANPWMGLLLKPKFPGTLRRRLGPVASLLERAMATGRCHLYEAGSISGAHPPAAAALAADVAIHGHLCAATAGLESALAGVPTLLLDREGWPKGRPHALGPRVAFTAWEPLWRAIRDAREAGTARDRRLGDWSALLDEMDPFRDGRGAERMGNYLRRVLAGLRAGEPRSAVLERVAAAYRAEWGADKVSAVGGSR